MRNDQIFVLLLVVLLPLSGCFENTVGDAEGADDESGTTVVNNYYNQTNQLPVIFSGHTTGGGDQFYLNVMAQDFDGNITNFGVDVDIDGVIDIQLSPLPYNKITMDYAENWSNPVLYNPDAYPENYDYDLTCQQWLQLIAIDDDGGVSHHPILVMSEYDDENDDDIYECTGRIIDIFE